MNLSTLVDQLHKNMGYIEIDNSHVSKIYMDMSLATSQNKSSGLGNEVSCYPLLGDFNNHNP
jgi:hypothetical protein